ncbi:hypothetical protein FITA111629_03175 [Filibacter tadaridae]|uniref:Lipoprotein n=1 Tax=Filibacter tadaridae TaxID=2483811 RepID=A0A3P5XIC8_9BACL|nr:hypothetical protein [Filibacter tadaridae]VDC29927.1 hypothetical protein FILTAD_02479 [Filibacter tadaridae]
MKRKLNLLYVAAATAILLSACGTDTENENKDVKTNGTAGTTQEVETDTESVDDGTDPVPESQKVVLKDAILTESDEQDYSIYLLPTYTLTSEEPGRDSLYVEGEEEIFMRIETMKKEDGTFDYLVENMNEILKAASDGNAPVELTDEEKLPSGEDISTVKASKVQTETGTVTGIVFERGDMIVRLTLFDSPKEEHTENFVRMGETITTK